MKKVFYGLAILLSLFTFSHAAEMSLTTAATDTVLTLGTVDTNWSTATGSYVYVRDSETLNGVKRYVQVFVVDPDSNVPIKDSILYKSEQFFTDETDMEIRHGLNLTNLLDRHNSKRIKMRNKDASLKFGRDIYLEPLKLRELKIVVSTIARF